MKEGGQNVFLSLETTIVSRQTERQASDTPTELQPVRDIQLEFDCGISCMDQWEGIGEQSALLCAWEALNFYF